MVNGVTKFHKRHRGVRVCFNEWMCVQGFIQEFEFSEGGGRNSNVRLTWRGV